MDWASPLITSRSAVIPVISNFNKVCVCTNACVCAFLSGFEVVCKDVLLGDDFECSLF